MGGSTIVDNSVYQYRATTTTPTPRWQGIQTRTGHTIAEQNRIQHNKTQQNKTEHNRTQQNGSPRSRVSQLVTTPLRLSPGHLEGQIAHKLMRLWCSQVVIITTKRQIDVRCTKSVQHPVHMNRHRGHQRGIHNVSDHGLIMGRV